MITKQGRTPRIMPFDMSGVVRTDDAKEGPKAFAEKRPPNWTNR
jgi:hypothetical protein